MNSHAYSTSHFHSYSVLMIHTVTSAISHALFRPAFMSLLQVLMIMMLKTLVKFSSVQSFKRIMLKFGYKYTDLILLRSHVVKI